MKIVVVGSINMDLVATVARPPAPGETVLGKRFETFPGGKGANQAVAAARLGAAVSFAGRVGSDGFGEELRSALDTEGIDTGGLLRVQGASGTAVITVSEGGANSIIVTMGANAALRPEDLDASLLSGSAMVLTQLETPIETVERLAGMCAERQIPLMLDPAPAQPLPESLLSRVTWLTPNESEAALLCGLDAASEPAVIAERLLAAGVRNVALKLGERGVYVAGADVSAKHVPAFRVTAVDTTAAGDCFNGAFAVAFTEGMPPVEAARFACAAAALSTTVAGAQPSMPRRDVVNSLP